MLEPLPSGELIQLLWLFNNQNGEVGTYEFRKLFSRAIEHEAMSKKYITRHTGRFLLSETGRDAINFLRRVVQS